MKLDALETKYVVIETAMKLQPLIIKIEAGNDRDFTLYMSSSNKHPSEQDYVMKYSNESRIVIQNNKSKFS